MNKRKDTTLYQFQIDGVLQLDLWGGRGIVGDDPGLGKTIQSLMWVKHYLPRGPSIFIVPPHLKGHWKKQAKMHVGMKIKVIHGLSPPRKPPKRRIKDIYVIGDNLLGDPRKTSGTWLCWLRQLRARLVIIDEAHRISNVDSQRSKASRELCRIADHVIMLTGTPVVNNPGDLWPLLNCVDPVKYSSFYAFRDKYCICESTPWGMKIIGAKNLDKLHRKLKRTCLIRRLKKDVLKDLPPIQRTVVPLELSPANRKEYEEVKKEFLKWLAKQSIGKARRAAKAERVTQFGYLRRTAGTGKLDEVIAWIEGFLADSDEKLIVFGVHKKVLKTLHRHFKNSVIITGDTPVIKRDEIWRRFLRKDKYRLLFGNTKAAGTGKSAKGVTNVATVEFDWNPATHKQAESRCHGIGRGREGIAVNSYYLYAKDTIEEELVKLLDKKQGYSDQAIDGAGGTVDFNVFDELEKALLRKDKR